MKNYDNFIQLATSRTDQIIASAVPSMTDLWNEDITLNQADIAFISSISLKISYALLRQYHEWLHSEI